MPYDHMLLFKRIALMLKGDPCRSLSELSRELQVSRRTIQNALKAVTGKKLRDLRDEALLEKVKRLLVSAPNMAIKEISFVAGFKAPRAFARAIRRACGISPSELRTRIVTTQLLAFKTEHG